MSNRIAHLDSLIQSPVFHQIQAQCGGFNLFQAFGLFEKELAYSRVIAYLLDSCQGHGCKSLVFRALWYYLRDETISIDQIFVQRERDRIDIVAEGHATDGVRVLAIENKINSSEGHRQLARYQRVLTERFREADCLLVFLTPTGRPSRTARRNCDQPVHRLSYGGLSKILDEVSCHPGVPADAVKFLNLCAHHFREQIMEDGDTKKRAREIWSKADHATALRLLIKYRPTLASIKHSYIEGARRLVETRLPGRQARIVLHPRKRGELREVKVQIRQWHEAGLPIEFVLHTRWDDQVYPLLHVVVAHNHLMAADSGLHALQAWVGRTGDEFCDRIAYRPVSNWTYWQKFWESDPSDDYGVPAADIITDDRMCRNALDLLSDEIDRVATVVEPFLASDEFQRNNG